MNGRNPGNLVAWWIIWGALLTGIFVIHRFVSIEPGEGIPKDNGSPVWLLAVIPLSASAILRWLVLPKFTSAEAAMPFFIIGMALAESAFMLGMFVFPAHKQELLIPGALGIFQFAPYFASRYHGGSGG